MILKVLAAKKKKKKKKKPTGLHGLEIPKIYAVFGCAQATL